MLSELNTELEEVNTTIEAAVALVLRGIESFVRVAVVPASVV
jgi:hypothetical protein